MDDISTGKFVPEYRKSNFKNRNRFLPDELRRRRENHHISLRKQKRDEELLKRRKIHTQDLLLDQEIRLEESNSTKTSNPFMIPQLQQILVQLQNEQQRDLVLQALTTLATILSPTSSDTVPPIDEAIQLQFVPILMKFMSSNNYEYQYQALWALANIASGTEKHTKFLIDEHKIIPALLNLMASTTSVQLKEEALLCLGNLCIDNLNGEEVRNTIIIGGGLVKLIEILLVEDEFNIVGSSLQLKRKASWVFMQLCKTDQYGRLPSSNWNVLRYIVPQLYHVLDYGNQDLVVLKDLLKSIEYLTNELLTNNRSTTVIDFKIHKLIIHKFLKPKRFQDLKSICIQIIKNLITATSQKATQLLIDEGLLKTVFYNFASPSNTQDLRKDCCSLIGLLNKCSAEVIEQVFAASLIPHLLHCLINGDSQVKIEACNALCNAIQYSTPTGLENTTIASMSTHISKQAPKIIPFLISQGILSPLCEMLKHATPDLQSRILKSLERILATGEFLSQTGDIPQNEYVHFLIDCGGKEILENLVNDALNDENSLLNVELFKDVDEIMKLYIHPNEIRYYGGGGTDMSLSTNSSDLSSTETFHYQIHSFNDTKDEDEDDNDEDITMVPAIGENGVFRFG